MRKATLSVAAPAASFDSLNNDCLVLILSHLPNEDMSSVSVCSRACCESRSNEPLDQTRSGTTALTESSTIDSLFDAIIDNEWDNKFTGNMTHLRIEGLEQLPPCDLDPDSGIWARAHASSAAGWSH